MPIPLDSTEHLGLPRMLMTSATITLYAAVPTTILLTSTDVIHSLSIPALAIKSDCIPGRLSQLHTMPTCQGTYPGYCAELCGIGHSTMPVSVTVYNSTLSCIQPTCFADAMLNLLYGLQYFLFPIYALYITMTFALYAIRRIHPTPIQYCPSSY